MIEPSKYVFDDGICGRAALSAKMIEVATISMYVGLEWFLLLGVAIVLYTVYHLE
jgi:hypothetical protein